MHAINRFIFGVVFSLFFIGGSAAGLAQSLGDGSYLDSDFDGFSNHMESLFGTDPFDADSHPTLADNQDLIKAYWPLLLDADDRFGDIDGELKGGSSFSSEGLSLDGKDGYVDLGNSAGLSTSNGIAWSVWIKPTKRHGLSRILGKFKSRGKQREYACFMLAGRVWVSISDNGSYRRGHTILAVTSRAVLKKNLWQHIVVSWEADGLIDIYVDGEQKHARNIGCRFLSTLHKGSAPLTLGAYDVTKRKTGRGRKKKPVVRNSFSGGIVGLTLFDHALSDMEVRELCALGSGGDLLAYVAMDFDQDGLPDWWERLLLGDTSQDANTDSDGDGLSNIEELQQGLDPNVSDNPDGDDEARDSDGDGLTDAQEAALGMDPNSPYTKVPSEVLGLKILTPLR